MAITHVQSIGSASPNVTSITQAYSVDVIPGNLLVITVAKYSPSIDEFVLADISMSAGAATLGTFTLDKVNSVTDGNGNYYSVAVYSVDILVSGSCTITVGGASAGSYFIISVAEFSGADVSGTRQDTNNAATANTGAPDSGNATSTAGGVFIAALATDTGSSVTHTIDGSFTQIYEQENGAANQTGGFGYRIVTTSTTDSASWSAPTTIPYDCVVQIYKAASTPAFEQEGFRFGIDDGNEAAHTWAANQDTNITTDANTTRLIRTLINTTNDKGATAFKLKYAKNGGSYATVPIGSSTAGTTPLIEAADATQSGNDTASTSWALSTPNASTGDLLIFCISWDDSTATTDVTEPAGKASETLLEVNATPATDASTETRSKVWYCICAGAWTAGTLTFTPAASESWTGATIRVPAGEFDASTPIGASGKRGAAGTAETAIQHAAITAGATDGGGNLCIWTSADVDPQTVAANYTQVANTDRGTVSGGFFHRTAAVTDNESISVTTVSTIASDSWSTVAFIVRAPRTNNDVYITTSTNIAAGGEVTTARLTAPSGKTTSDFTTGRRWDDENGTDTIDILTDDYTEVEWCVILKTGAASDYFDFRTYAADVALDTYTVTPRWSVTAGAAVAAHNLSLLGVGG
jgi:hypothetical protein